jgi:hypothetical protein
MKETSEKRKGTGQDDLFMIPGIQPRSYSSTEVRSVFDQIDLDKNGCLDEADIRHVLLVTGLSATDEEVREMIRMVDKDGSGTGGNHANDNNLDSKSKELYRKLAKPVANWILNDLSGLLHKASSSVHSSNTSIKGQKPCSLNSATQ